MNGIDARAFLEVIHRVGIVVAVVAATTLGAVALAKLQAFLGD